MKRNKIILAVLILSMIALIFSGCGGSGVVPTVSSTPEPSDDFILIQVKDSESNIIFIAGEKNEDTLTILGGKNSQGDPIKITGTLYVSKQGDGVFLEAGIDGLPTYIIDSEGNKITFENYSNSTVDIALYDSNENLIEGPITIDVNPQDLLEIKQLYDSSHLEQKFMPWWGNFIDVQFDWALSSLAFANNGVGMIYENGGIVGYKKPWEREINFFDLLTEDNFVIIYEATLIPTIVDDLSDLSDYVSSILDILAEANEYIDLLNDVTEQYADISGNWSGQYSTNLTSGEITYVSVIQDGADFNGEYYDSTDAEGYFTGEFTTQNQFIFTMTQTNTYCQGTFNGNGVVEGNQMTITFSGHNCMGDHSNGNGVLAR